MHAKITLEMNMKALAKWLRIIICGQILCKTD